LKAGDGGEIGGMVADEREFGNREIGNELLLVQPSEVNDAIRLRIGKRAKNNAVDNTENSGVGADSEGQSEDGDGSKTWRFAQHAQSEAQVQEDLFEPDEGPDVASVFPDARDVAEFEKGSAARFLGGHAASDVVLRFPLDVVADVGVEIFEHALAARHDGPPIPPAEECAQSLARACPICWSRGPVAGGPSA